MRAVPCTRGIGTLGKEVMARQQALRVAVREPNRYRNLWHKTLKKPEYYENNAKRVGEHRGVVVFRVLPDQFDFVVGGACITQRAGWRGDTGIIDQILDGGEMVGDAVHEHLKSLGFTPKRW